MYLDTDVELKTSIDTWIEHKGFFVFETERNIATGLGFGAVEGHHIMKAMLDYYKGKHFVVDGKVKLIPCPVGNTEALAKEEQNFKRNGTTQLLNEILIISSAEYTKKAIHHGTATWVDNYIKRKGAYRNSKIKVVLRDYRVFDFVERWFGKKAVRIYTFFVYDLLEMGVSYYIKRIMLKLKGM